MQKILDAGNKIALYDFTESRRTNAFKKLRNEGTCKKHGNKGCPLVFC